MENDIPDRRKYFNEDGISNHPAYQSFSSRGMNSYANELEHFIDLFQGIAEPIITKKSVLSVTRIADACMESAKSGLPVKLEWSQDENC